MSTTNRFSPEVRERAVRMVLEHAGEHSSRWAAICSIAEKFGCTAETLRKWVQQAERDKGVRPGLTSEERVRLKELERENRELRRVNEILRKASYGLDGFPVICTIRWRLGSVTTARKNDSLMRTPHSGPRK